MTDLNNIITSTLEKVKSGPYERHKLFTRAQEPNETSGTFQAALTAQAARSEFGALKDELLRDLFIKNEKHLHFNIH